MHRKEVISRTADQRNQVLEVLERHKKAVGETIQCPVCLDILEDPVRIPDCTHAFCRRCLVGTQQAGWTGCDICFLCRNCCVKHDVISLGWLRFIRTYSSSESSALDPNAQLRNTVTCHHHFRCPVCRKILAYDARYIERLPTAALLNEVVSFWRANERREKSKRRTWSEPLGSPDIYIRSADRFLGLIRSVARPFATDSDFNSQADSIIHRLTFLIKHAFQYTPKENEAILFKCVRGITELESTMVKKDWERQAGRLRRSATHHESRPDRMNLEREELGHDQLFVELVNPLWALEGIFDMIGGRPLTGGTPDNSNLWGYPGAFNFNLFHTNEDDPLREVLETFIAVTRSLVDQ